MARDFVHRRSIYLLIHANGEAAIAGAAIAGAAMAGAAIAGAATATAGAVL